MPVPGIDQLVNFNLLFEEDYQAIQNGVTPNGQPRYFPIPPIIPTLQAFQPIIAVNIATLVPQGNSWNFAGYLNRFANTGVGSAFLGARIPLFLSKFNLVEFTDLQVNYNLRIVVPKWFTVASVAIYEFYPPD